MEPSTGDSVEAAIVTAPLWGWMFAVPFAMLLRMRRLALVFVLLTACEGGAAPADGGAVDAGSGLPAAIGPEARRAALFLPDAHDGVTPLPLLVLLHGYGASGAVQDAYLGISRTARARGLYVVVPDGTLDAGNERFWNATPACCDFGGVGVDDVAYMNALIAEMESLAPIADVFFVGHSNGGFMSYRMACERADRVSAIVSLAGSDFLDATDCVPSEPVSVLQIHGDQDTTILYDGVTGAYPSARDVIARWAERASCDTTPTAGGTLDLESVIPGEETDLLRHDTGCERDVALWTIRGGAHIPAVSLDFAPHVIDWLLEHRR